MNLYSMANVKDPDLLEKFIKLRLTGYNLEQIKSQLSNESISDFEFQKYHHEAGARIRYIQENEVLNTRVLHAQRYEMLYDWFIENDFDKEAMKMLENVERLLGLHSNTIGLSIHNLVEKKPQKANIYDWHKLNEQEHNRLKVLVEKATIND